MRSKEEVDAGLPPGIPVRAVGAWQRAAHPVAAAPASAGTLLLSDVRADGSVTPPTVRGSQGTPPGTDRVADAGPPARNVALGQRPHLGPQGCLGPRGSGGVRHSWDRSSACNLGLSCGSRCAAGECHGSRCGGRPAPSACVRCGHHVAIHRPDRISGRRDPGGPHLHVRGRRAATSPAGGVTRCDCVRGHRSVRPGSVRALTSGISAVLRRGAWDRDP